MWVAYSGGLDSHTLLHVLAALREQLPGRGLAAVHVDHGLAPRSAEWALHCIAVCRALEIPCHPVAVEIRLQRGHSREAEARRARYAAFASVLEAGDCLLTAHHRDDQAETLLLQLIRGAGPAGLAGMPRCRPLGRGRLLRPLLDTPRRELRAYAEQEQLVWIEDHSNFDTSIDRNFLRHQVLPVMRTRWPGLDRSLARSAGHCGEAAGLLEELAGTDLGLALGDVAGSLSLEVVAGLSAPRRRNLVRLWCRRNGVPVPPAAKLDELTRQALLARPDRSPRVAWGPVEARRYGGHLYLMRRDAAETPRGYPPTPWDLTEELVLPAAIGRLRAEPVRGRGVSLAALQGVEVRVAFRRGGERCRPAGSVHLRTLKRLLQERGVPPWERARIPLLLAGNALVAVADLWVCEPYAAGPGEAGVRVRWEPGGIDGARLEGLEET